MRFRPAFATGTRRWSAAGGGGGGDEYGDFPPISETKVISAGHGSRSYEVTELTEVVAYSLNNFYEFTVIAKNITVGGGGSGVNLFLNVSKDGGSTWEEAAADNRYSRFDAGFGGHVTSTRILLYDGTGTYNFVFRIKNFNADMETAVDSQDLKTSDSTPRHRAGLTIGSAEAHDAFRLYLGASSGSPVFTGGELIIEGRR